MKTTRKRMIAGIVSIILAMCLSVTVFAYTQTITGNSWGHVVGSRTFTVYNTVSYNSAYGVRATTTISCNSSVGAGEMGVYPMLQNSSQLIVLAPGYTYNTSSYTTSLTAGTSYYSTTSGTYYSGGGGVAVNDQTGVERSLQAYLTPGLTIGSSKLGKIGK